MITLFEPTPLNLVRFVINKLSLTENDVVYDLGSGDGRIVVEAAKKGVKKAVGIEINPTLVKMSNLILDNFNLPTASVIQGDIYNTDFSDATVIFYGVEDIVDLPKKLVPQLSKGTKIISLNLKFGVPNWKKIFEGKIPMRRYITAYNIMIPHFEDIKLIENLTLKDLKSVYPAVQASPHWALSSSSIINIYQVV